jgi:hypothetical protein
MRCGKRALDVDRAARILDDENREAFAPRVFGRPAHAEIKSKARDEHAA